MLVRRKGPEDSMAYEMVGTEPGSFYLNPDCILESCKAKEFLCGKVLGVEPHQAGHHELFVEILDTP